MNLQAQPASGQSSYRILREADLREYLAGVPAVVEKLGGVPADWSISEVGDGNLNLVFIVKGSSGGVAVKQALPYVRAPTTSTWRWCIRRGLRRSWCRRCCITTVRSR
jgi:5-methylthioribose kinase